MSARWRTVECRNNRRFKAASSRPTIPCQQAVFSFLSYWSLPRCLLRYFARRMLLKRYRSETANDIHKLIKNKQKSKTDIPSFEVKRRIWNRRFCCKHNDSISSDPFVAIGRWNIMFAPIVIFYLGCEAPIADGLRMTAGIECRRTVDYGRLVFTTAFPTNKYFLRSSRRWHNTRVRCRLSFR